MGVAHRVPSPARGLPRAEAALEYATRLHAGQLRKADGAPFIDHPREVAALLHGAGAPEDLIAAGALHDVIEKTPATAFDLRRRFGSRIAGLVVAVSEDERIPGYTARKAALRDRLQGAGEETLMLYAADKISKVRELGHSPPAFAVRARRDRRRRLSHYRHSLSLLRARLPDSPLVEQLGAELTAHSRWLAR
jgi:(p)ppGpp synthase/HD superfamily hydrolase